MTTNTTPTGTEAGFDLDRNAIRDVFMRHGFTIKEGQTDLKPYVYEAAEALIALARRAAPDSAAQPDTTASVSGQLTMSMFATREEYDRTIKGTPHNCGLAGEHFGVCPHCRAAQPVQAGEAVDERALISEIATKMESQLNDAAKTAAERNENALAGLLSTLAAQAQLITIIEHRFGRASLAPVSAQPIHIEYDRIVKADERALRAVDALDGMGFTYDEEIGWLAPVSAQQGAAEQHNAVECVSAVPAEPASQHEAIVSTMPIETIVRLMDENTDRDFGLKCEPFARAVEVETIRRCRAQGGVTSDSNVSDLAAKAPAAQAVAAPSVASAIASMDRGEDEADEDPPGIFTKDEVLDMLERDLLTDSGADTLRNGDSLKFPLDELAMLANRAAERALAASPARTPEAAPEQQQANDRQQMSLEEMYALCRANPAAASGLPLAHAQQAAAPGEQYAYDAACNVAKSIYAQHYREGNEEWRVLPDLRDVISQISNMAAGMTRTDRVFRLTAPTAQSDNSQGFSLYFSREDWGVVFDGVMLEIERSEARKAANSESNSDARTEQGHAILAVIRKESAAPTAGAAETSDDARDAARWRFRKQFLENNGAFMWTRTRCQLRRSGELVSDGATEEEAIDAAMSAHQAKKDQTNG